MNLNLKGALIFIICCCLVSGAFIGVGLFTLAGLVF